MTECVSCGKEIPAGSFFCADCYVRMKGRRGPSAGSPRDGDAGRTQEASAGVTAGEAAAAAPGPAPAAGVGGALTPVSGKKVVSIKPQLERGGRERGGRKRFTVTITLGERTYAALDRMRGRGGKRGKGEGEGSVAGKGGRARSGRPRLKAVAATRAGAAPGKRGLKGAIAYRDRPMDGGDKVSAALAALAALAIIVLTFRPWARISMGGGDPSAGRKVEVAGTDLGALPFVCIALAAAALLYMMAAKILGGPFAVLDYGVVFILAGVVVIPLLYAAIAPNAALLAAAAKKLGMDAGMAAGQFGRQTLWPAYLSVLAGALLAFAGLVRLSERGGEAASAAAR